MSMWDNPNEAVDTSTGFLVHFKGTVKRSWWSDLATETDGKVNGDGAEATQLFWQVEIDDVLQDDYSGKVPDDGVRINFGVGKGWLIDPDREHVVEHEDDDPDADRLPRFRASSAYGRLLQAALGTEDPFGKYRVDDGGEDPGAPNWEGMKAHMKRLDVSSPDDLRDCTIWEDCTFEFRGLSFPFGRGEVKWGRAKPYPFFYLGDDNETVENTAAGSPEPATQESKWYQWTNDGSITAQLDKLERLAKGDHAKFVKNASALPAVKSDDDLRAAIEDSANFG